MTRDIAVIGAGLAGLYAAWSAASHGADVELYEKGIIGTKHNCGEMFTEVYTSAPEECKLNRIEKFKVIIGEKTTDFDFGETSPFVMTDKHIHELILKKKCEDLGVIIKEKTKALDYIKGRKIIDATGASNYDLSVGKAVDYVCKGMRKGILYKGIHLDDKKVAVFDIRDDLMGYKWFFPKGDDLSNIGEGVYDYKYRCELMSPLVIPRDIVYKGGGILPMPTMNEFYYNMTNDKTKIKVGNAAGLVNSFLGGGEHLAVISGILAGELVAKDMENKYYEALIEIIGDEMRLGISGYELLRKLDIDSVSKLLELKLMEQANYLNVNAKLRKTIKKWISLPEVTNDDLTKFVGE